MCVPFGPFGPKGVSVTLRRPLWTPVNNPLFFRRVAAVLRKPVCTISQQENIRRVAAAVPLLELE